MFTSDYHFITVKDQGPVTFQYLFHVKELLDLKLKFSACMFSIPTTAVGLGVSFIFCSYGGLD